MDVLRLAKMAREGATDAELLAYADECHEAEREAREQEERDCEDGRYVPGCGEYDTVDSRGRPLLSRFNDAGEPRW